MRDASVEFLKDNDHFELWEYTERFATGHHWGQEFTDSPDQVFPAVQVSWKIADSIHAKVFNQPLRPVVVPEESSNFPVDDTDPWRDAVRANLKPVVGLDGQPKMQPGPPDPMTGQPTPVPVMESPFQGSTDNEIAAEVLSAALDFSWEKGRLDSMFEEAERMALWYGTCFILTDWDDTETLFGRTVQGLKTDIYHPRYCGFDPANTTLDLENGRWFFVDIPSTLQELINMFPEYEEKLRAMTYAGGEHGSASKGPSGDERDHGSQGMGYYGEGTPNEEGRYMSISGIGKELQEFMLEMWFVKDHTTTEEEVPYEVPVVGPLGDVIGMETKTETVPVPKYENGWRAIFKVNGLILMNEGMDVPHGELPVTTLRCYNVPGRFLGMGVLEQTLGLNLAVDRHLKYAIENARRTSQNKYIINEYGIENLLQSVENTAGGIIRLKADVEDIRSIVLPLQGMDLPQAHQTLVDMCRELAGDVTGERDLIQQQNLPKDASGRFVEAVESASNARITRIRKNLTRAIERVAKQIVFLLIENEEEDRFYSMTRDWSNPSYISMNPSLLRFDEFDFEAKWDVKLNAADVMPLNPLDQDTLVLSMVDKLLTYPPEVQMVLLDVLNIPQKATVRRALNAANQAAARAAQEQPPDPEIMKIQAESQKDVLESRVRLQQSIAENVGDALEKEAAQASTNAPGSAHESIMAMPQQVIAAMQAANMTELLPAQEPQGGVPQPQGGSAPPQGPQGPPVPGL
jgi:hypothetical protein